MMTAFEARKKNVELYGRTLKRITESCEQNHFDMPIGLRDIMAANYAATLIIREITIEKLQEDVKLLCEEKEEENEREVTIMYEIGDAPCQYERVLVSKLGAKTQELLGEGIKEIRVIGQRR